jgi:hypothetical protein
MCTFGNIIIQTYNNWTILEWQMTDSLESSKVMYDRTERMTEILKAFILCFYADMA